MLQLRESLSFAMLARRYDDAMAAVETAIQDDDFGTLKDCDQIASMSFEEILARRPESRKEELEMLHFLLEKLSRFDREGALWQAIRDKICELFESRR